MAMNLVAGWSLLSALLVLGVQGEVPAGELSEIQNKTIQLVMEKFHQRDLSNGYRMTSVVKAVEELYVAGLFVNVEFLVKQTSCHKHHWTKPECQPTKNAKTYNCFGCFKFEHESHTVFSHVEECVLPRHLNQGRQARRNDLCKEVERRDNGKKSVGKYSFLRKE
ncbi:TPA: hypothetical protein GDO54_018522 [Pyxicephalus adspersus]|uniref:Retinoic acid receptor responder protein 2 n=1 Tax=Pyxicephalus adspersus TaxID=30357 RepID=A0AAV2ZDB0_PYXAD|nr:TPA: hypothetical protein GDO54_018522 [Pyxicephalus adspersus]